MSSAMTRPEIPSIVVHNGSASTPSSPNMERQPTTPPDLASSRSLSKQPTFIEDEDRINDQLEDQYPASLRDDQIGLESVSVLASNLPSLPVTPPSPSPAVSPSSPAVSSPASSSSPSHQQAPPASPPSTNAPFASNSVSPGHSPCGGGGSERVSPVGGAGMAVGQGGPPSMGGGSCRSKSLELPSQRSSDSEKDFPSSNNRHRHTGTKAKLLQRSHAMREETSPPPDIREMGEGPYFGYPSSGHVYGSSNNLTVGPPTAGFQGRPDRRRLRQQGSSQGSSSFDGPSPCLSRDSSAEYTDSTGTDLVHFIIQTLHKNQKDRMMLLKIERELVSLVKDSKRTHHKFPQMSSYQRMLVHRCAAFFGLEHNVDQGGTCVIVNTCPQTRIPEVRFKDYIRDELIPPDEPKKSILRRDFASFEDGTNYKLSDRHFGTDSRRSKSYEEREEEYEKVRKRIFSQESFSMDDSRFHDPRHQDFRRNSHDDGRWPDSRHWSFMEADPHRMHYDNHRLRPKRLPKVQSFESHDLLHPRSLRPPVSKSLSFGGYSGGVTVLSRGDSVASNPPPSRLSKQDSNCSRFSDGSSSGYQTQRQDTSSTNVSNTLSTTPSPTAGQHQHLPFGQHVGVWGGVEGGETQPVIWAVTDLEAVPHGAMLINPQSGQPYMNADGSTYRYDPSNPPPVNKNLSSPKMSSNRDKGKSFHGESCELDDVSEAASSSSKGTADTASSGNALPPPSKEMRKHSSCPGRRPGVPEEEDHYQSHSRLPSSHFFQSSGPDGRPFSQDSATDVSGQMRTLSVSGSCPAEGPHPDVFSTPASAAVPHGYMMPRQHYPQAFFYVPAGNMPAGPIKYVYPPPPYQMTPVAATPVQTPSGVQQSNVPPATMAPHPPPTIQTIPPAGNMQPALATMATTGHPQTHTPVGESGTPLPPGYMHSNYAVLAYPSSGLLTAVTSSGNVHEQPTGTTYYCQIPGPAALAPPNAAAGPAGNPPPAGATVPVSSLPQYPPITQSSTATSTFPMGVGYYNASGVTPNNTIYPSNVYQGFSSANLYGTHSHTGPSQMPQQSGSYRPASTPPQTPSAQGFSSFNSSSDGGSTSMVPGQYIVIPSNQASTPTSQAGPQYFTTLIRPQFQQGMWQQEKLFHQGLPS